MRVTSTPPSVAAPEAGALPVGDAQYAIPGSNVVYLATNGNDGNNGLTVGAPKATLQSAIAAVPAGGTIVIRGGEYRQTVTGDVTKQMTIQNYPGEAVWFDGSTQIPTQNWTANGNGTWSADLLAQFPHPGDAARFTNSESPMGLWPDGVWVDGKRYFHRPNTETPSAEEFTVDYGANTVTIGTNPAGKEVRATARERWMVVKAKMTIRGFGIRRYADHNNTYGMVTTVQASGGTLMENMHLVDAAMNATGVNGTGGSTMRYCTVVRAGYQGIGSNEVWDSVIENCLVLDANWKKMNVAPAAGSIKLCRSTNGIVRNCIMDGAIGVWYDVSCYDNWCYNNVSSGVMGFFYEISRRAVFFSNRTPSLNPGKPLEICNSSEVRAWNNDFTRGTAYDIWIHTDDRKGVVSSGENPDGVQNWHCVSPDGAGSEVVNNVLANRNGYSGTWRVYMQGDGASDGKWGEQYIDRFASNVVSTQTASSSTTNISRLYAVYRSPTQKPQIFTSMAAVESTFPSVASNNLVTQVQNPTAGDVAGWQSNASTIPDDICDKVGIPRGTAAVGPVLPAPVARTPSYL